jgi:ribosomal protein S18 acetylase RimI-like enzyme
MPAEVQYIDAGAAEVPLMRELFSEYGRSLGIDLSFQDFDQELATLPGKYASPDGAVIIARLGTAACGCVALRRIDETTCEMKRLYVRPDARGLGIGAELVRLIVDVARARGYRAMRLDTLPTMKSAIALYASFGFREIPAYTFNPVHGAVYMEKML